MKSLYQKLFDNGRKVNWTLLLFLVLVLNVKLVIKLAAFIIIVFSQYRRVSFNGLKKQKQLYFYFGLIVIALINYLLQVKQASLASGMAFTLAISLWFICAAASYYLYRAVQKEEEQKLHTTLTAFFTLHIGIVFLNLLRIMIECRSLNPYTYKGLNQKYYINTGDFISGISFDSPVTTAMISAFAVLYLLYRRQYFLSMAAMASMLLVASNLTNIFLVLVLLFAFVFKLNKIQKSIAIVQICLLVIFIARISPQNNEYIGRFAFKMLGMTYDLPKKIESLELLKTSPDSMLTPLEKRKKTAALYLDSVYAEKNIKVPLNVEKPAVSNSNIFLKDPKKHEDSFYVYKETEIVANRINKYSTFLEENYTFSFRDSLEKQYDWKSPGKWIAFKQLVYFFEQHPGKLLLGTGAGNFSSRVAFKTTSLGMAGRYPAKYTYIHPGFLNNHLYTCAYYHSKKQTMHAAENTPDSTYNQLIAEYGIPGFILFALFYMGSFLKHWRKLSFGAPILLLISGAFCVEYWFEQLSIVILFELLMFVDIKSKRQKAMQKEVPLS
jgi:hypothetical protein